jgi:hypothetical protein
LLLVAALIGLVTVSVVLGGTLTGCSNKVVIHDPPLVPVGDAGDECATACGILSANHCPVGDNPRCAVVCRIDQAQGVGANLDPACILHAQNRSQIRLCGVSCP